MSQRNEAPVAFLTRADKDSSNFKVQVVPPRLSFGKAEDNDICLSEDRIVSRHHCVIHVRERAMVLEDLNSTNGTYLNGKRIEGKVELPTESQITVGRTHLFVIPATTGYDSESLVDSYYARKDSILIPATGLFEKRTEAFLVVDLVKSTELLRNQDDLFLIKLVATMGKILDRALAGQEKSFMKCTGDGFLTRFDTADAALAAALALDRGVSRHFPEFVKIAVALHWGSALYREEEGLIGKDIHAVFGLEKVRSESVALGGLLQTESARSLILMTQSFWNHLAKESRDRSVLVGAFQIKGLDELENIYRWVSV